VKGQPTINKRSVGHILYRFLSLYLPAVYWFCILCLLLAGYHKRNNEWPAITISFLVFIVELAIYNRQQRSLVTVSLLLHLVLFSFMLLFYALFPFNYSSFLSCSLCCLLFIVLFFFVFLLLLSLLSFSRAVRCWALLNLVFYVVLVLCCPAIDSSYTIRNRRYSDTQRKTWPANLFMAGDTKHNRELAIGLHYQETDVRR